MSIFDLAPDTDTDQKMKLATLGFKVVDNTFLAAHQLKAAYEAYTAERTNLEFDIDGLVIAVDNLEVQKELGFSADGKQCPLGAIAIKFPADRKQTVVRDIEWSGEGTTYIQPVGIIDPVELDGATITRVSLKSLGWCEMHKVGIGTVFNVVRSGMVIPNLPTGNDPKATPLPGVIVDNTHHELNVPENCPCCGAPTTRAGARLMCTSSTCEAKEAGRCNTFLNALKVKGMGHRSLLDWVRAGITLRTLVEEPKNPQILRLVRLHGLSEAVAQKVIVQLHEKAVKS